MMSRAMPASTIFDEMDGACEKCGEVELMEPEGQNLPDTATTK